MRLGGRKFFIPSNKGYGSSCFSSFFPLASFSFFLFLPPAPRNSPHHQIHTRTHTHTPRSKALPSPSLRSSPVLFPTPWPATFQTGLLNLLYCCLKGIRSDFRRCLLFPFWTWIQESMKRSTASLRTFRIGRLSRAPPQSHSCLPCLHRLRNISRGLVL